jgi:hypothetical protein
MVTVESIAHVRPMAELSTKLSTFEQEFYTFVPSCPQLPEMLENEGGNAVLWGYYCRDDRSENEMNTCVTYIFCVLKLGHFTEWADLRTGENTLTCSSEEITRLKIAAACTTVAECALEPFFYNS